MSEVIREQFIRGKHSTVVTGTHGKTTTTSLMAWVMEIGGLDPSFLVGGVAENFGASFKVTDAQHFVIEGDEYDTAYWDKGPKFLHYLPELVILNNIEYDHADIYPSLDAVKKAFRLLVNLIPASGAIDRRLGFARGARNHRTSHRTTRRLVSGGIFRCRTSGREMDGAPNRVSA